MNKGDYYALLGVERTATVSELRRAFRRLTRKYHPEINPGDRLAKARYLQVCEAFGLLSTPDERERYDRVGAKPKTEPEETVASYGFEGFDFSMPGGEDTDIFPEIFHTPKTSVRSESERDGEDLQHILSMSFVESLKGVKASFQVTRLISCESCDGFGEVPSDEPRACTACDGRGRAVQSRGHMLFAKPCPECGGSAVMDRQKCPDCMGAGRLATDELIEIETPPGVEDGYRLAIHGKGQEGLGGGRTGDLHVLTHVDVHPFFSRKGDNLCCSVPITFTEAALGTRMEVPTMEGWAKVRVPAGVQSGQELRLSARGAPTLRGDGRGDLLITIRVVTPAVHDQRSQEILRELGRLHPDNPRRGLWSDESERLGVGD